MASSKARSRDIGAHGVTPASAVTLSRAALGRLVHVRKHMQSTSSRVEIHLRIAEPLHDQEQQSRLVELGDGVVKSRTFSSTSRMLGLNPAM